MTAAVSGTPGLWRGVCALGVAQIVSWGTLFYAIAVLGPPMRDALHVDDVALFGSFTLGLLVSGLAAPAVGRRIDAHGGRGVLAAGSVLGALACVVLGFATVAWHMLAGWLIAGLAMALCLYDPAFATLHGVAGGSYRRSVTVLTLFGGFASTVFWPLSQYLLDTIGWRDAFLVHGALHAALCLPLHLAMTPARRSVVRAHDQGTTATDVRPPRRGTFAWLAIAFSLAAFVAAALSAHLIGLLTAGGLAARDAVLIGAMIGPMQVAGRLMEMAMGTRIDARVVGMLAFGLLAAAVALLPAIGSAWILALLFALLYGWSNGVMTIVRGTVPAELFGPHGYGRLLGRLARPAFASKALAPVALTFAFAVDPQRRIAGLVLGACAAVALVAYLCAARSPRPATMSSAVQELGGERRDQSA